MKKVAALITVLVFVGGTVCSNVQAQDIPTRQQQIKAAVSAAPPNMQDGAKVLGYNQQGELITLREGTNEMICLADDPGQERFHVACYFDGLEPFMKRGRELRARGLSRSEVDSIRQVEIEAGELEYPQHPMGLYSLSGQKGAFDYETGTVKEARPLYVVYVPYATEQSTGISTAPAQQGGAWLMEPGTPWAHIMYPGQPISGDSEESEN